MTEPDTADLSTCIRGDRVKRRKLMTVREALAARHSSRAYRQQRVSGDLLLGIIEAATRAPSWGNTQPWEIFVAAGDSLNAIRAAFLENLERHATPNPEYGPIESWPPHVLQRYNDRIAGLCAALGVDPTDPAAQEAAAQSQMSFFGAPAVIFLCSHPGLEPWSLFDLGLLAQSIMLVAAEEGLSTTPAFSSVSFPDVIRRELDIPAEYKLVLGIAIGYEVEDNPANTCRSERRPIAEAVRIKGA
jgi:nitroreductase